MPYGIPASKGGESLSNIAKMEACIKAVQRKEGVSESSAIAICKTSLGFTKGDGGGSGGQRPR